jgi:hypothetical protein
MSTRDDNKVEIDQLSDQLVVLRSRLLRTARALILSEDRRADVLTKMARDAPPSLLQVIVEESRRARQNADSATSVVITAERMHPELARMTPEADAGAEPTGESFSGPRHRWRASTDVCRAVVARAR